MFAHLLVEINTVLRYICHLDSRCVRQHSQVLQQSGEGSNIIQSSPNKRVKYYRKLIFCWLQPASDLVDVLASVLVCHVARGDVQLEVWSEVLKVVVVGQLVGDLLHT